MMPLDYSHRGETVGHCGPPHHGQAPSRDVADWLRKLGLEQYEPAFRANDVDAQVLPRLTAEDLISIGVNSVGHRRRLLDAIAALAGPQSDQPLPGPVPGITGDGRVGVQAERRQLTVIL